MKVQQSILQKWSEKKREIVKINLSYQGHSILCVAINYHIWINRIVINWPIYYLNKFEVMMASAKVPRSNATRIMNYHKIVHGISKIKINLS